MNLLRRQALFSLAVILAWLYSSDAVADKASPLKTSDSYFFTRSEVFGHSAAFPAKSYINFLIGPPPEQGEFAFARTKVEAGFGISNFELSAIHRNDYNITFTEDAAFFSYRRKNGIQVPLDQPYEFDVHANQYQASGLKLSYKLPFTERFAFRLSYSHLISTEIVSGF